MLSMATVGISLMLWLFGAIVLPGIAFIILFSPGDSPRRISTIIGILICSGIVLMRLFVGPPYFDSVTLVHPLTFVFILTFVGTILLNVESRSARLWAHVFFGLIFAYFVYYVASYFWLVSNITGVLQ